MIKKLLLMGILWLHILSQVSAQKLYGLTGEGGTNNLGAIIEFDLNTNMLSVPFSMEVIYDGASPLYTELKEYQGKFYGMTSGGGVQGLGVIFEWNPSTNAYSKMADFNGINGSGPRGSLALYEGNFYGMTRVGGANNLGVIFKWDPTNNTFTKMVDFNGTNGSVPFGSLTLYNNKFYGMTSEGGTDGFGVIFEWDPANNTYTKMVDFNGIDGKTPYGGLTLHNNKFYGMTNGGGANDIGVIFEWNPANNAYTKKVDFTGTNGRSPFGNLTLYQGKFYGTTLMGGTGANNFGVIFEWDPITNIFSKKMDFHSTNGMNPFGSLTLYEGKFYGMTHRGGSNILGVIFEWDPASNAYAKKVDFDGTNGKYPYGSLAYHEGKFYGMTQNGGTTDFGVIFEWDPSTNTYTKKVDFKRNNGQFPVGSLTYHEGSFYGTTFSGGNNNLGVIFEWDPSANTYTKKVDFNGANGRSPIGSLTFYEGKFYGITNRGGAINVGLGLIFEWDPVTNIYTKKMDFDGINGKHPVGGLALHNGRLYGMTREGGANDLGVIFEWDPVTNIYVKKVDFDGTNGQTPDGSLTFHLDKFYGMTKAGGVNGKGVIFEWDPLANVYVKKVDFNGIDGSGSVGSLTFHEGKFYGMTSGGGAIFGRGVIFEWDPIANIYTKKIDFDGANGESPIGSLTINKGKFYGMTEYGGANEFGVIFEWDPLANTYTMLTDFNGTNLASPQGYLVAYEEQATPTDNNPPSTPLLTIGELTETSVELTWTASTDDTGVTGYDVYNGTDLLETTSGLNFLVDNLNACTEYTFSVVAKDAAGNTAASNEVNPTTTDETPPIIPVIEDLSDCSITLTPPVTTDNCAGEIIGTTTDSLTYDTPGTYIVTWSFDDGNGNISTTTQNIEIIGYPEPAFSVASPSCVDNPTTFIDNSTNVAPDATYLWDFGDGNTSSQKGDVTHNYTDNLGIYTVSLTISNGTCENSFSEVFVQDRPPVLSLVISQEISAPGASDGAIDLSYIGKGVMALQWSNGETTEDIQNLSAGTYSVIVTNQEGCSSEAEITLNDPEICYPADEVAFYVAEPACQGASITFIDNSVNVDPEATYLWDFGDGNTSSQKGDVTHEYTDNSRLHTVTLTISNGACIESFSNVFTLGAPPLLSLSVSQEISAPGGADGAIDLTIEGKGPFTYKWSNGATTEDIEGLPAGTYSVVVTNVLSCLSEAEITMEEPTGSCFMDEIVSFKQGRKRNGGRISKQRSNPEMALGTPQENDTYNFVALGFGGSITLKLGQDLYDDGSYQPDFILVETSFGRANQMCYSGGDRNYPEMAFLEVSQDSEHWYSLPNVYCRTSFVDISPAVEDGLSYVRYIRITDASNKSWFEGNADGFDVDGIITCQSQVLLAFDRLTNARTASAETSNSGDIEAFDPNFFNHAPDEEIDFAMSVFPNPVDGQWLHLEYNSENTGMARTRLVDMLGKTMIEKPLYISMGFQRIDIDVSGLPPGNYFLRLESDEIESSIHKIVKY